MLFRLTIPCDVRLVPAVRRVAERVAQCAGYSAGEAVRVASSVAHAADTLLRRLEAQGRVADPIDIRFRREGGHLDVWMYYTAPDSDIAAPDPAISGEALRQGMDSVEFGRQGEVGFCRLRRVLPSEKVDHQCEVPPADIK